MTPRPATRQLSIVTVFLLAAALLVVACGASGGSTSAKNGATTTTQGTTTTESTTSTTPSRNGSTTTQSTTTTEPTTTTTPSRNGSTTTTPSGAQGTVRDALVQIYKRLGLTDDKATCLADAVMAKASNDPSSLNMNHLQQLGRQLAQQCNISQSDFKGLGGGG